MSPDQPRRAAAAPTGGVRSADLHPVVAAAAGGVLPRWAVAGPHRRAHVERVRALMAEWAEGLGLDEVDRARWQAAATLHDALRDERPERLLPQVPAALRDLAPALLHGPAAAERLRGEGVRDDELLDAIAFHTIGDAGLGALGRALFSADFLEPGRKFLPEWRAELRARMPAELDAVALEVTRARIRDLLERGRPVHPRTADFWNALLRDAAEGRG